MNFIVKPHQRTAVNDIVKAFKTDNEVQIHMACGTGKTFISNAISSQIPSKRTVMFVPSIFLAHQACLDFIKYNDSHKPYLVVCSKKLSQSEKEELDHLTAIIDNVTVCTSTKKIKEFVLANPAFNAFCTYMSARKLVRVLKQNKIVIDYVICDESHHLTGNNDKSTTCILNDLLYKRRLSQTATPMLGKANLISQEDLGPIAHIMSFRQAVDENILCPYDIQLSVFNKEELVDGHSQFAVATAAIKRAMKNGCSRGLTFHSNVANAHAFHKYLNKHIPSIKTFTLNFSSSAAERNTAIEYVREHGGIITNVRVLSEGFDFPELDYIVVVDPKTSVRDIVQSVGRVMRKFKGKDKASIVIPMVYNDEGINTPDQSKFINVVEAMALHDELLFGKINAIKGGDIADYDTFEGIISVQGNLTADVLKQITHRMITLFRPDKATPEQRFAEFKTFIKKHGRLPRSESVDNGEHIMYRWMMTQHHTGGRKQEEVSKLVEQYKTVSVRDLLHLLATRKAINGIGKEVKARLLNNLAELGIKPLFVIKHKHRSIHEFHPADFIKLKKHLVDFNKKFVVVETLKPIAASSQVRSGRLKKLGIKTYRRIFDKRSYISRADANKYTKRYS